MRFASLLNSYFVVIPYKDVDLVGRNRSKEHTRLRLEIDQVFATLPALPRAK